MVPQVSDSPCLSQVHVQSNSQVCTVNICATPPPPHSGAWREQRGSFQLTPENYGLATPCWLKAQYSVFRGPNKPCASCIWGRWVRETFRTDAQLHAHTDARFYGCAMCTFRLITGSSKSQARWDGIDRGGPWASKQHGHQREGGEEKRRGRKSVGET